MMKRTEILTKLRAAAPALAKKYHVRSFALFGSYSRGEATGESDIDLLVDFEKPIGFGFIDLATELEQLLNNKVDLVSRKGIKPSYFSAIEQELLYV